MIHILRNSRNASDPFICAVQVLKKQKQNKISTNIRGVEFLFFSIVLLLLLLL